MKQKYIIKMIKAGGGDLNELNRIKEIIDLLNKASYAYYAKDNPIMSDKQYDDLYDELSELELSTGIILAGSPTQKVQGTCIESLKKVKHSKLMLSANKTKDINEIKKFIGNHLCVMSWKEDGLTIVLRYVNGIFTQAITRGSGDLGEDVTHTMEMCKNIPFRLPYCVDIEVRGECVISWKEFERINSRLNTPYKHPRNLASGSVRQLDSNVLKDRELTFKAFELVQDDLYTKSKDNTFLCEQLMNISESFDYLRDMGFDVVEHEYVTKDNVEELIKKYIPENYAYPVDGLIFEYDDYLYGKSLGETAHHTLNMLAFKWKDDLYETTLTDIEWNTSKSGLVNPVAVFEPVDLDGAMTTRATLHNISYIEDLQLGVGDTILLYRANMVIPKVHDNLTRSNTWKLPDKCPCCGGNVEIHNENGSKTLHCMNPECRAKLVAQLTHFVSKHAINIDGLSEQTLQKLVDLGWIKSFQDIMNLHNHATEMMKLDGFGKQSVNKLMASIDKAKHTTLERFLYSLSIPLIGRSASKDIAKVCHGDETIFISMIKSNDLYKLVKKIDGFGDVMFQSLFKYCKLHLSGIEELVSQFTFEKENSIADKKIDLSGKTFVITGSLNHYKNRDELVSIIEQLNGKVSGSVSAKTSYLINNDINSTSSKNVKARKLGIPIITEEDFIKMIS